MPPILWPAPSPRSRDAPDRVGVCARPPRAVPARARRRSGSRPLIGGSVLLRRAHAPRGRHPLPARSCSSGSASRRRPGSARCSRCCPMPEVWPIAGALTIPLFVQSQVTFIPSWIKWNYSGFEAKAPWRVVPRAERPARRATSAIRGSSTSTRRSTRRSAPSARSRTCRCSRAARRSKASTCRGRRRAPFVFYIQSEVSGVMSCPFPDWGCARLDLARGVRPPPHDERLAVHRAERRP